MIIYGIGRYFIEFFRGDPGRGEFLGFMSGTQAIAILSGDRRAGCCGCAARRSAPRCVKALQDSLSVHHRDTEAHEEDEELTVSRRRAGERREKSIPLPVSSLPVKSRRGIEVAHTVRRLASFLFPCTPCLRGESSCCMLVANVSRASPSRSPSPPMRPVSGSTSSWPRRFLTSAALACSSCSKKRRH